jgi:hypothetical protein
MYLTLIFITPHVSPLNGRCLQDGLCQVSLFASKHENKRKKMTMQSWNVVFGLQTTALFEDYFFLGCDTM